MCLSGPLRRNAPGPSGLRTPHVPRYLNGPNTGDSGLSGENKRISETLTPEVRTGEPGKVLVYLCLPMWASVGLAAQRSSHPGPVALPVWACRRGRPVVGQAQLAFLLATGVFYQEVGMSLLWYVLLSRRIRKQLK